MTDIQLIVYVTILGLVNLTLVWMGFANFYASRFIDKFIWKVWVILSGVLVGGIGLVSLITLIGNLILL